MKQWRWIAVSTIAAVHDRQIAEHGGLPGTRDRNVLESALARPRNQANYSEPDHAALAAAYTWGLARNHAFNDGNKRIAWIAANLFLELNGFVIEFDAADAYQTVQSVADNTTTEEQLAEWIRIRSVKKNAKVKKH